jgi:apolipoprotein N-acyltransferase
MCGACYLVRCGVISYVKNKMKKLIMDDRSWLTNHLDGQTPIDMYVYIGIYKIKFCWSSSDQRWTTLFCCWSPLLVLMLTNIYILSLFMRVYIWQKPVYSNIGAHIEVIFVAHLWFLTLWLWFPLDLVTPSPILSEVDIVNDTI